jgi:hypothetical protein
MFTSDEIKAEVERLSPPEQVKDITVDIGADSNDDPAVWISLYVDEEVSDAVISELSRFAQRVKEKILRSQHDIWPYVTVRSR